MNNLSIFLNVTFIIVSSVLSITDNLNTIEYYFNADFYSEFLKSCCFVFLIAKPIFLFLYYSISLIYLSNISDQEFSEVTSDFENYEMIYFRNLARKCPIFIIPASIYLAVLSYVKMFSLYSLKFLIEYKNDSTIFKNSLLTILYPAIIIQSLFQSMPQILFQSLNNLLMFEDKHYMRGVLNFSTGTSILFICLNIILYYKDKNKYERTEVKKTILNL